MRDAKDVRHSLVVHVHKGTVRCAEPGSKVCGSKNKIPDLIDKNLDKSTSWLGALRRLTEQPRRHAQTTAQEETLELGQEHQREVKPQKNQRRHPTARGQRLRNRAESEPQFWKNTETSISVYRVSETL